MTMPAPMPSPTLTTIMAVEASCRPKAHSAMAAAWESLTTTTGRPVSSASRAPTGTSRQSSPDRPAHDPRGRVHEPRACPRRRPPAARQAARVNSATSDARSSSASGPSRPARSREARPRTSPRRFTMAPLRRSRSTSTPTRWRASAGTSSRMGALPPVDGPTPTSLRQALADEPFDDIRDGRARQARGAGDVRPTEGTLLEDGTQHETLVGSPRELVGRLLERGGRHGPR